MSEDASSPDLFVGMPEGSAPLATPLPLPMPLSAGAQLAHYREMRGWSVVEVADQLNLAPRQVQALEDENYAALPGLASTRGFIRAYAKLLKVDPEALLAGMSVRASAQQVITPARRTLPQAHYSDNRLNAVGTRQSGSHWYAAVVISVLAIGALALAQYADWLPRDAELALRKLTARISGLSGPGVSTAADRTDSPAAGTPIAPPPKADAGVPAVSGLSGLPGMKQSEGAVMQNNAAATPTIATNERDVATTDTAPARVAVSLPTQRPAALVPPAVGKPDPVVAPAPPPGGNQLVLHFRNDSWVELKGRGKNTVASKMYRAGTSANFEITEPVQLLVGNAAGVDATLRGAPLAVPSPAKNNVARLVVK